MSEVSKFRLEVAKIPYIFTSLLWGSGVSLALVLISKLWYTSAIIGFISALIVWKRLAKRYSRAHGNKSLPRYSPPDAPDFPEERVPRLVIETLKIIWGSIVDLFRGILYRFKSFIAVLVSLVLAFIVIGSIIEEQENPIQAEYFRLLDTVSAFEKTEDSVFLKRALIHPKQDSAFCDSVSPRYARCLKDSLPDSIQSRSEWPYFSSNIFSTQISLYKHQLGRTESVMEKWWWSLFAFPELREMMTLRFTNNYSKRDISKWTALSAYKNARDQDAETVLAVILGRVILGDTARKMEDSLSCLTKLKIRFVASLTGIPIGLNGYDEAQRNYGTTGTSASEGSPPPNTTYIAVIGHPYSDTAVVRRLDDLQTRATRLEKDVGILSDSLQNLPRKIRLKNSSRDASKQDTTQ